jgi:hypothetical protein
MTCPHHSRFGGTGLVMTAMLTPPGLSSVSFGTIRNERKEMKMGLDMYAFVMKDQPSQAVDFTAGAAIQLHYWRKHPDLHGWMEMLYRAKGGSASSFNCVTVQLTNADIEQLEADIRAKQLPHTEGFFFGSSDGKEFHDDLEFIAKARAAFAEAQTVYYTSWWFAAGAAMPLRL